MSILFDPRDARCKSPFGAVTTFAAVDFTFYPRGHAVTGCTLLAHHEFSDRWTETELLPTTDEDGAPAFSGTFFAPSQPELIWYHFRLRWADGGESCYGKDGFQSWDKVTPWQLTVYDGRAKTPGWFGRGVTYQIFPDRFYRKKARGVDGLIGCRTLHERWDETPLCGPNERGDYCEDFFGGDLAGIAEKLDYLASLHVTTLYLNPIFEAASNHRYDTADYETVDPLLGDEQDFPDAYLLGEVWEDGTTKVAYSKRRRYLLGGGLNGLMNYPFRTALLSYLAGTSGAEDFRDAMETIRENYPSPAFYGAMNFLSTHDTPRLLTLLGCEQPPRSRDERAAYRLSPAERERGTALLKLAALVLYAFPGSPTVYYGDEAGMESFEDPFNRGTYPWGHEDTALLDWFRTLGRLRAERESLQSGDIAYLLAAGRVLCFARRAGDEVSLCAVNAGAESASVDLPWAAPLAHDALSGQSFLAEGGRLHITLAPYDALLLTE